MQPTHQWKLKSKPPRGKQESWTKVGGSVADFPKIGGWFSQNRRLIFQSRWLIFPKSVADFPKMAAIDCPSRDSYILKSITNSKHKTAGGQQISPLSFSLKLFSSFKILTFAPQGLKIPIPNCTSMGLEASLPKSSLRQWKTWNKNIHQPCRKMETN